MMHFSFISGTILAGVLSASGAGAAQKVAGAPEQSSPPAYSCRAVTAQADTREIDYGICVEGTPLLVQPGDPQPICLLNEGVDVFLLNRGVSYVQASVASGPCSGQMGWVSEFAIGRKGECAM